MVLLAVSYAGFAYAIHDFDRFEFDEQVGIYMVALFAGTMICHGELVRSHPAARYLTRFYLMVSAGGALGGILATLGLAAYCIHRDGLFQLRKQVAAVVVVGGVAFGLIKYEFDLMSGSIETSRTFFGVIRVKHGLTSAGETRLMKHGQIDHGSQFVDPSLRRVATHYYGEESGIGVLIDELRQTAIEQRRGLRIGFVGLGAGTLCTYGRRGDVFRIYEIDPEVERLARKHFTYLEDCEATVEVALGDARIVLEREAREGSQKFDILALDAFSGDAVPTHLLTRQAIVAITIGAMADRQRGDESLQQLAGRMYLSAGLGRRKWNKSLPDAYLLVVVVEKERKIHVQVGNKMHERLRPSIEKILNATLRKGVSGGLTSAALRDCVEQLSKMLLDGARTAN